MNDSFVVQPAQLSKGKRAVGLRRLSFPAAADCNESVTGCWSRLSSPKLSALPFCELFETCRAPRSCHHDSHRPPRQGPPTVSFISFYVMVSTLIPRDFSLWIDTFDLTKMCHDESVHLWVSSRRAVSTCTYTAVESKVPLPFAFIQTLWLHPPMKWCVTKILPACNQPKV